MPPLIRSRYERTYGLEDDNGLLYLTEREPFRYDKTLPGIRRHRVATGDTLQVLAYRYFPGLTISGGLGPEHLWWVIADFQPVPIQDPTVDLEVGRVLYIPSVSVVRRRIFGRVG